MTATAMDVIVVCPYLRVKNAAAAIEFYVNAFGARERYRLSEPGGRIGHAELLLGNATLMLSDEYPEHGILGPQEGVKSSAAIHLHVLDTDAIAARAEAAGAVIIRQPTDHFYGERTCSLRDPFGHEWLLGHQIEDVSPKEMQRRFTAILTGTDPYASEPDDELNN